MSCLTMVQALQAIHVVTLVPSVLSISPHDVTRPPFGTMNLRPDAHLLPEACFPLLRSTTYSLKALFVESRSSNTFTKTHGSELVSPKFLTSQTPFKAAV
ncbi:hypothetical protein K440DRAFT_214170 [Wilcoxina mikolae CBS 423.85]|nr:hypothetical protein K440DRAFT_214170 [Wilcoxina mikolae CBS 423.85]